MAPNENPKRRHIKIVMRSMALQKGSVENNSEILMKPAQQNNPAMALAKNLRKLGSTEFLMGGTGQQCHGHVGRRS